MAVIAMMLVTVYNELYSWILAIPQHDNYFFRNYDETRTRISILLLTVVRLRTDHHHGRRRQQQQQQQQHLIPLLPLHWNMKMIPDILLRPRTIHPTTNRMFQHHSLLSRKQSYRGTTTPAVVAAATRIPLWTAGMMISHHERNRRHHHRLHLHKINLTLLLPLLGFR
jgi:hypothetical protein